MTEQPPTLTLREAGRHDIAAITAIYNHYIENTVITFEEDPLTPADMQQRHAAIAQAGLPWLVACEGTERLGYAYVSPWKPRSAFRYSVETSIYLAPQAAGRGIGKALFAELDQRLACLPVRFAGAVIALPNDASVRLHEQFGYRKIGRAAEVGYKFGRWLDVGYWQKHFAFEPGGPAAD
ncbi:GNAT family N-acetyltransferase [Granulosicoccaceae sp. 1_MG-2023]|nr:GNAT family N-acetyltransferase [Granulosicoccaceae sp. 1_MG-2023]